MRGSFKVGLHPLFLLAGVLSALTGRLPLFLAAAVAALEHECAHAFAAKRYGYSLDRIVLMPYGAVVSGELNGIGRREYLAVLAAGPLSNLATGIFFVALWWFFPETYPYTEAAAWVSFSLFFVNLLPAWPLDGGRALSLLLRPLGEKKRRILLALSGLLTAAGVAGYFVYTCFSVPDLSALIFALLLVFGSFGGGRYRRAPLLKKDFRRGMEERRIALSADCTLGGALRYLREDKHLVFVLYEGEEFAGELTEEEFVRAAEAGDYSLSLGACLKEL